MIGHIASINPMSFDSGPGIRVEILLDSMGTLLLTPEEMVDRIRKFRPYFGPNGGGVTFKGDLLDQLLFLHDTCLICQKAGINTCIEINSSFNLDNINCLNHINIVILDTDDLTMMDNIINTLNINNINILIKHEIKKNINDNYDYIILLKKYLEKYDNIIDIELIADDILSDDLKKFQRILKEV